MRLPSLNRSAILLAVAILAGLLAAWTARRYLQDRARQLEADARVPMVERVVAADNLPLGTKLAAEHFAVRRLPASAASSDSLPPARFHELEGGVLLAALKAGDPILPVHTARTRRAPFSGQIGAGRRAMTIPVDVINSVSGLLEPGDLIDLYVSFEHQRRRITAPLLQGVLVLATGHTTRASGASPAERAGSYATVTLDTSPEDAIKLVAARQGGTITALLRHPDDGRPDPRAVRGDLATLLGVAEPKPGSGKRRVQVIYGNRANRGVAGLAALAAQAGWRDGSRGVFELPYMPELASAWMREAGLQESDHAAPAQH